MLGFLSETYRHLRNYRYQVSKNAPYDVRFYNFWDQDNPDMWLYQFIHSRGLLEGTEKKVCFYSTFGQRSIIGRTKGDVNIFFTGENLKTGHHHRFFSDHYLSEDAIDFAMGFEYFEDLRYLRFPLWIMYMFDADSDDGAIIKRCSDLRFPHIGRHHKFASLISRGDVLGIRTEMFNALSAIETVDCAGTFMHNCDDLWELFSNDKKNFISEYKFNICPENSNCSGYVTEKIFQAIDAGCIPVYWGSFNNPEPEVVNPNAVVFWNKEGNNDAALRLIAELNHSRVKYEEFACQPRLKDGAENYVLDKFHVLESKIREIL